MLRHRSLEELYDVRTDPDCLHNLVSDPGHAEQLRMLRAALATWMEDIADPALGAFLDRENPAALATFMAGQEKAAQARRAWRRAIKASVKREKAAPVAGKK